MRPCADLVVRRDVEGHQALEERLGRAVVREERVAVDAVQVTWRRHRTAGRDRLDDGRVEAQQPVEPRLDGVGGRVADRLRQRHLVQHPTWGAAWNNDTWKKCTKKTEKKYWKRN